MLQWVGMGRSRKKPEVAPRASEGAAQDTPLTPRQRRRARLLGTALIALGIPGLVLPFLQGVLFLLVGAFLLSFTSSWFDAVLRKCERRHPKIQQYFARMRRKAQEWL